MNAGMIRPYFTLPTGDMAAIDGHIMITRFWAHDSEDDGLYELDTTTGELIQRANIEGATLIIDSAMP